MPENKGRGETQKRLGRAGFSNTKQHSSTRGYIARGMVRDKKNRTESQPTAGTSGATGDGGVNKPQGVKKIRTPGETVGKGGGSRRRAHETIAYGRKNGQLSGWGQRKKKKNPNDGGRHPCTGAEKESGKRKRRDAARG